MERAGGGTSVAETGRLGLTQLDAPVADQSLGGGADGAGNTITLERADGPAASDLAAGAPTDGRSAPDPSARRLIGRRWWPRLLAAVAVALLVAAATLTRSTRIEADRADARLADARAASAGAEAREWATGAEASRAAITLRATEVEATDAARTAAEARARLAETGVSEADLRRQLDESRRRVERAEQRQADLAAEIDRQRALLPEVETCLDEAVRSLSVKARNPQITLSGDPSCARPETGAP